MQLTLAGCIPITDSLENTTEKETYKNIHKAKLESLIRKLMHFKTCNQVFKQLRVQEHWTEM